MEYSFRPSFSKAPCTVVLTDTHLIYREGENEFGVPYVSVVEVQIDGGQPRYETRIYLQNGKKIVISNRFFQSETQFEDQSRSYATFIRVLHFHLKDKSRAIFTSGRQPSRIGWALSASIVVSFAMSFLADYFGLRLIDPFFEGLCLAGLAVAGILAINLGHWPRHYSPTDIPLEFLP